MQEPGSLATHVMENVPVAREMRELREMRVLPP